MYGRRASGITTEPSACWWDGGGGFRAREAPNPPPEWRLTPAGILYSAATAGMTSAPPMYGRRASGITTEPSACWWDGGGGFRAREAPNPPPEWRLTPAGILYSAATAGMTSAPPMYGRSASGIRTEPSACWWDGGGGFRAREAPNPPPEWRLTPAGILYSAATAGMTSAPPMYGRSASGIRTEPSACW